MTGRPRPALRRYPERECLIAGPRVQTRRRQAGRLLSTGRGVSKANQSSPKPGVRVSGSRKTAPATGQNAAMECFRRAALAEVSDLLMGRLFAKAMALSQMSMQIIRMIDARKRAAQGERPDASANRWRPRWQRRVHNPARLPQIRRTPCQVSRPASAPSPRPADHRRARSGCSPDRVLLERQEAHAEQEHVLVRGWRDRAAGLGRAVQARGLSPRLRCDFGATLHGYAMEIPAGARADDGTIVVHYVIITRLPNGLNMARSIRHSSPA